MRLCMRLGMQRHRGCCGFLVQIVRGANGSSQLQRQENEHEVLHARHAETQRQLLDDES